MKAIKLLEQQHRKVKATFARIDALEGDPAVLVRELANELGAHMAIEQQIFYPTVREMKPELVDESYEEHSMAELALKRLLRTSPGDPAFRPRIAVLEELIESHVEKEESELFPAAEKALGAQLESLGTKMEKQFDDAKAQGFESLVPSGFAKTSADEFERLVQAT
jgi:iron-sulfur cluster repair protein YtfE (RIC family)